MNIGDKVKYFSPVNKTLHEAEVVEVWDNGLLDLRIGEGFKLGVQVHMMELPAPFLTIRGQQVPLPFVVYEANS